MGLRVKIPQSPPDSTNLPVLDRHPTVSVAGLTVRQSLDFNTVMTPLPVKSETAAWATIAEERRTADKNLNISKKGWGYLEETWPLYTLIVTQPGMITSSCCDDQYLVSHVLR